MYIHFPIGLEFPLITLLPGVLNYLSFLFFTMCLKQLIINTMCIIYRNKIMYIIIIIHIYIYHDLYVIILIMLNKIKLNIKHY